VIKSPLCQRLDWDSEFFGLPIARLAADHLDPGMAEDLRLWGEENPTGCIYFLCKADDSHSAAIAHKLGFRFTDVRLTLERYLSAGIPQIQIGNSIRPSAQSDIEDLKSIACRSHTETRFYADGNFPRDKCSALYSFWIERSCTDYADEVLVAAPFDRPVAYITCKLCEIGTGQIGLLAVAADARGEGWGSRLLQESVTWFAKRNCRNIYVVTQGRNISAQRLYQQAGFRTRNVELWFHFWPSDLR